MLKHIWLLIFSTLLVACSGGGGGGSSDTTAPVVTLNGDSTVWVEVNTSYTELGATAVDGVDGTVTVTTTSTVNTAISGTYQVTYSAADAAGNTAEVVRTVTVVPPPVVTLVGYSTLSIAINSSYNELGATASDSSGNSLSVTTSSTLNEAVAGTYVITYSATDSHGFIGTKTRTVTVIDTPSPVISLNGSSTVRVALNGTYAELGVIVTDSTDVLGAGLNLTTTGSVNTSVLGTYTITYTATDSDSNVTTETRTVIVVPLLNDTGISWGGNYPSGNNVTCIGEVVAQQDCSSGRDADGGLVKVGAGAAGFDFTKIDSDGSTLAAGAASWSCVKDNQTGLIWEVKTTDLQGAGLNSKYDQFTWYSTDATINGGLAGSENDGGDICTGYNSSNSTTFCNTEAFVARLNASNSGAGLCGATDWRLPTIKELKSLTYLAQINPAIDTTYFPNTALGAYWSITSSAQNSDTESKSWGIHYGDGYTAEYSRSNNYPVRLVRTAP